MTEIHIPPGTETRPTHLLVPYARNSRTHSEAQVEAIVRSMQEFGFTNPVLIRSDHTLIAGHGRVLAAQALGLVEVPVVVLDHLTDAQVRAYVIADNKLAELAGWDSDLLEAELLELSDLGFDLSLTGFSDAELQELFAPAPGQPLVDEDLVPATPVAPVTRPGDVWLLGAHRLACGDSREPACVERVLNGAKPHLMVTDPPYGVEYDAAWRTIVERKSGKGVNELAIGKVMNDDRADWSETFALFPGDVAYVWHAGMFADVVSQSLSSIGFQIRSQIIWAKNHMVISRGHYHWQHEPCWYAVRKGRTGHWNGDRKQTTVWDIDKPLKSETGHSTQKPVECMRRPIENNSKPGDAVYEPFSGSGTTLIAAELTGRMCHAVELSPSYVDVAVLRWQAVTGREAVLAESGKTYAELRADIERQETAA